MVEIGAKKLNFCLILSFFVHALVHPVRFTPRFYQMKDVIMIYSTGKFHKNRICGCEIKNFQSLLYWFSIHEWNGSFLGFLGPYSPKYCLILLKMWPEVVSINKKTVFEKSFKILNFGPNEMEWNCNGILNQMKVYSFGPFWSPVYYEKTKSIDKNQNFCKNCILRNN